MQNMINKQLGLISGQQHSYINRHYGKQVYNNSKRGSGERSIYDKPLEFETWFNRGLEVYKKRGFKFQWLNLGTLKVILPNGKARTRTYEDFYQEWKFEYCPQFPSSY